MSLSKITCPSCGVSSVKHIPLQVKFATCHKCGHKFDIWKEGITPEIETEINLTPVHNNIDMGSSSGGWLKLALMYAISIYSLFFVVVANNTKHSPGWPNSLEFLVSILYVPTILVTAIVFLVLVAKAITTKQVFKYIFPIFLCTPMIAYSLYNPSHAYDKSFFMESDKVEANDRLKTELTRALDAYFKQFPERFHYVGADCEITIDGFGNFVKVNYTSIGKYGAKVKDGEVIDPWGKPVRYIRDRLNERLIRANGKVETPLISLREDIDNPEGLGIINTTEDYRHRAFSIIMNRKYWDWYDMPKEPYKCNKCGRGIDAKPPKNSTEVKCPDCGSSMESGAAISRKQQENYKEYLEYSKQVPVIDKTHTITINTQPRKSHERPTMIDKGVYKRENKDGTVVFSDNPNSISK